MFNSLLSILSHPCNKGSKINALFRLVWWKINQILFKLPTVVELTSGTKCICYPNSSYGGMVVYTRLPEYNEIKYFTEEIKSDSIVIDVGANIGVYSLIAAAKSSKGKIYSFEPLQRPLDNFKENIAINNFEKRIEVYNSVVSDHVGHEYFKEQKESEISHISFEDKKGSKIKSITLDSFIKTSKIRKVDIIKIDVEGAELKVLKGMRDSLQKKIVKTIILEVNKNEKSYGYSPRDLFEYLSAFSYKLFILQDNLELKALGIDGKFEDQTFNIVATLK